MRARCPNCGLTLHTSMADFQHRCLRCSSLDPLDKLSAGQELRREFASSASPSARGLGTTMPTRFRRSSPG